MLQGLVTIDKSWWLGWCGGSWWQDLWQGHATELTGYLGQDIYHSILLEIVEEMAISHLLAEECPLIPVTNRSLAAMHTPLICAILIIFQSFYILYACVCVWLAVTSCSIILTHRHFSVSPLMLNTYSVLFIYKEKVL